MISLIEAMESQTSDSGTLEPSRIGTRLVAKTTNKVSVTQVRIE
jgi:hypothetical protein